MTQAFYRKWRPQTWDDVVGQDHVIQTLRNAVSGGRTGHAYLFAGPRGTGKTSTARLLAKALNCTHEDLSARPCNQCDYCRAIQEGRFLDLIEIDAASNTSVEDIRDLRDKINFSPNQGRFKVYIIDEVHMLSTAAFNALLKTLEEPPPHAVFILATTEVHKIPATVLSRCQRHEFRRLPPATMVPYLKKRIETEGLQVDEVVLPLIARQATGSLRDAISLLDQFASTGEAVTLQMASDILGTAANEAVIELVRALIDNNPAEGLNMIQRALDGGTDARQFCRQMVDYLHNLLLVKMGTPELAMAGEEDLEAASEQAGNLPLDFLLEVIRIFQDSSRERYSTRIPSLPLEIAFLEAVQLLHRAAGGRVQQEDFVASAQQAMEAAVPGVSEPAGTARGVQPPAAEMNTAAMPPVSRDIPTDNQNSPPVGASAYQESPEVQNAGDAGRRREPSAESASPSLEGSGTVRVETHVPGGDGDAFEVLRREWRRFLAEIRKRDPILQGLVNSSRPLAFQENFLILGFEADILREKMLKPDNMTQAQEALAAVLGREAGIRCVLRSEWSGSDTASDTARAAGSGGAGSPPAAESSTTGPAPAERGYDENGIVAAVVEEYGAEVVEVEDLTDPDLDPEG